MMGAKEWVRGALEAVEGFEGRIYQAWIPKEPQLPMLVFRQAGGEVIVGDGAPMFERARIEVQIYGGDGLDALADQVTQALSSGRARLESAADGFSHELMCRVRTLDFSVFVPLT